MESPLQHTIFHEGAALYRKIQERRLRWQEAMGEQENLLSVPWKGDGTTRCRRGSVPLHVYYPLLFHSLFNDIPIETLRVLSLADRLYTEHLLSYDRIVDEHVSFQTSLLFLAHLEHMQSLKRLYLLFPLGHPFWDCFYDCYFETWKMIREEKLLQSHRIGAYPMARFCAIAKGKTAILKPFSLALAFLSRKTENLSCLSTSLDQHHIALILLDDLEDWRQDYQRSNFTFLLTRLIQQTGLSAAIRDGHDVPPERIGRLLYGTGLMERQLRLAEVFFRKAVQAADELPLPLWKSFNQGFGVRCRALRHDLAEIRRREERRARVRKSPEHTVSRSTSKPLLRHAFRQLRAGLAFLRTAGTKQGAFPLSASPHTYMCPSTPLAPSRFVTTLLARSVDTIKDIDSAADPLLYHALKWLEVTERIGPPPGLPATLEGAFALAPAGIHQLLQQDRTFVPTQTPLPDGLFWANYLYTCYQKPVRPPKLTAFVLDCLGRGFYTPWSHRLSFGPVEAAWARHASRPLLPLLLFCQALKNETPRAAVHTYLLAPYRANRSWSHTTETALTLLCLLETAYHGPELSTGLEKLSETQELDGSWSPNAVYKEGDIFYGSRELTTAWCLEVLARCGSTK